MATYQILYWKDIPSQIRVEGDGEEIKLELDARIQELIDKRATDLGATNSDDYLAGWVWSDPEDRSGNAQEVATNLKRELEEKHLK
jgi:hypothetical protein